jgi:hypothetical protein
VSTLSDGVLESFEFGASHPSEIANGAMKVLQPEHPHFDERSRKIELGALVI